MRTEKKQKVCIGYGAFEDNKPGTRWGPHWCERCDALRRDHITAAGGERLPCVCSSPECHCLAASPSQPDLRAARLVLLWYGES